MSSLSNFIGDVRVLIGDNDPDIKMRDDAQVTAALQTAINLGKVVGDQTAVDQYSLNALGTEITPDLTATSDPRGYCQLIYHTAKLFAIDVTPTHWRTRAFSETVGENRERVYAILQEIYATDNGGGCGGSDYDE